MVMRCSSSRLLERPPPLILAASRAASWVEVLDIYTRCCHHLRGIYTPTVAELKDGLRRMPSAWAVSLFYYSVIKTTTVRERPAPELVLCALKQFKQSNHVHGMQRLIEEDINTRSLRGLQAALTMVSYLGMWEKALAMLQSHPSLARSAADRRNVIDALASSGRWAEAMNVLALPRTSPVDYAPAMIRPIVRQLGVIGAHEKALRLVARSLAAGYILDIRLFATLAQRVLLLRKEYTAALHTAQALHLLTPTRAEAKQRPGLYASLVQCLYAIDPYEGFTMERVVRDINARTSPRETLPRYSAQQPTLFSLRSEAELYQRYQGIILTLTAIYARSIGLPNWHTKPLNLIAAAAAEEQSMLLVVDTNFLIHCAARDHVVDRFFRSMQEQWPETKRYKYATIVVPFTSVQEAQKVIWDGHMVTQQGGRAVMWSRLLTFLRQPSVRPLALAAEYPSTAFSMISKMAYSKMPTNMTGDYRYDPDLRVLNVCLSLQHALRGKELEAMQGSPVAEGIMLFAFMKYHVRRYNNAVKGPATTQLLLCTMDRRLERAATLVGVNTYPRFT